MSKIDMLRVFVSQRLTAATEEIFEVVESIVTEYEEDISQCKQELERHRILLKNVLGPQIRLERIDESLKLLVSKEEASSESYGQEHHMDHSQPDPTLWNCSQLKQEEQEWDVTPRAEDQQSSSPSPTAVPSEHNHDQTQLLLRSEDPRDGSREGCLQLTTSTDIDMAAQPDAEHWENSAPGFDNQFLLNDSECHEEEGEKSHSSRDQRNRDFGTPLRSSEDDITVEEQLHAVTCLTYPSDFCAPIMTNQADNDFDEVFEQRLSYSLETSGDEELQILEEETELDVIQGKPTSEAQNPMDEDSYDVDTQPYDIMVLSRNATHPRMHGKKNYCLYCEKPYAKIVRHLKQRHPDKIEVAQALAQRPESAMHKLLMSKVRNMGNYHHNCSVLSSGQGQIVPKRKANHPSKAGDYVPCKFCFALYIKKYIWRHHKLCKLRVKEDRPVKRKVCASSSLILPTNNTIEHFKDKATHSEEAIKITKRPSLHQNRKPRKSWSQTEVDIIQIHFKDFLKDMKIPRKDDCQKCLSENQLLKNNGRDWKAVKYFVHNKIAAIKGKAAKQMRKHSSHLPKSSNIPSGSQYPS